ncbi:ABC-type sugar transport system substrate-binding protein [Humibacillus xanthopallidus]|uniref:ABC-type sugar transport system substrate-binding protein n=1 Tax=Humibacillus xanthopallidus TaxID=412689 RepID=A0A543PUM6_9MICO|nr:substrate-binding domain-containing protein [Humibacillus xanthopallidus]TQN47779.1 ABC-type sugar transport system substrate-binding protein [Humibacillus xanthopallidus]
MSHHSTLGRAAIAAVAGGSLVLLAACGSGGTQPAAAEGAAAATGSSNKTIVFSPLALKIPAMKGLSEGVTAYGKSKGYEVLVQDPDLNPQKQVTDLQSVIESGRAAGAWVIAVQPSSLKQLVTDAQAKKVPLILNGVPADYGMAGLEPLVSFSTIDYAAQGKALGEELGNCVNEKLGGKASVLFTESGPGTAGKAELEGAAKTALAATAPNAKIVATVVVKDRQGMQTDTGAVLQGNPDITAVMGQNDEGALGALGAFAAAGKELPCVTEAGGNDEVLAAVKSGKIYAVVALQFAQDMVQSFDTLTAMIADPTKTGVQLTVPQKVIKAGM